MRTWQAIRNWFRRRLMPSRNPSTWEVCDELEALLDLCCYAASQAAAGSKLIERELGRSDREAASWENLAEEHSDLQGHLQSLRTMIETLNSLLNSARKNLVLGQSRTEREESQRMVTDLLNSRDLRELEQAVKDIEQTSIGSQP